VTQHTRESLRKAAADAVQAGVGASCLRRAGDRDEVGSGATDPDGILNVAIRETAAEVGD
jgi:porphobilinogen synthase